MNSKRMRSGAIYALLVLALGAFLYTSLVGRTSTVAADMPVSGPAEILELDTRVWQRVEAGAQTQTRTFSLVRYEGGLE